MRVEVHPSTAWRWTKIKEKEYEARQETRGRKKALTDKKAPRAVRRGRGATVRVLVLRTEGNRTHERSLSKVG